MSLPRFTFLNATGTPELSKLEAKRMRAHITKTNFAKRRMRLAEAGRTELKPNSMDSCQGIQGAVIQNIPSEANPKVGLLLATQHTNLRHYAKFQARYWSLVSQDGIEYPGKHDEAAWIDFLASDPALVDSIMAIGIRNWSPEVSSQDLAEIHSSRASRFIIQRINTGEACTDTVLGAVVTMAFGERLRHNNNAWSIHIYGLAQLLKARHSQGIHRLPSWLVDLLTLDLVNDVFNFPRFYHKMVLKEVSAYGHQAVSKVAVLSDSLVQLWKSIAASQKYGFRSNCVAEEIEETFNRLLCQAQNLSFDDNPAIQATSRAIELLLYLSWRPKSRDNLMAVARELKEALGQLRITPCAYTDLTSYQLMIGAIAADEGSETRAWFVAKLKNAIIALQSRGWTNPLEVLQEECISDSSLMACFRTLWKELGITDTYHPNLASRLAWNCSAILQASNDYQ